MNGTFYDTRYDELYHYGVLGMKWGIRKARKRGLEYQYKSHGQKKMEKKVARAEAKGRDASKERDKLATYKERDAARQSYAEYTKTGHAIARALLLGPFGSGTYNRARAAGSSVGSAVVQGLILPKFGPIGIGISKASENSSARSRAGVGQTRFDSYKEQLASNFEKAKKYATKTALEKDQ